MQWRFLQSLEGTAVLHFDSMMGAFGGHANHGDASRYALRPIQFPNHAHVQMSCASPIKYGQDVTGDDPNWLHLLYPLACHGSTPFARRALFAQHRLLIYMQTCLRLFHLRVLTQVQESTSSTCCMSGIVTSLFGSQVPAAYRSVHKPVVLC